MKQNNPNAIHFDLDKFAARVANGFTMNVHDYSMQSPTLARVVLSYTGVPPDAESLRLQIAKQFNGDASVVAGSFRQLSRNGEVKSMVGFIKASREVVAFEDATANADKYKVMASNLLMDKEDKSMWEIKSGSTGKYLAKQGSSDLSELVHLAQASVRGIPKFNQIAFAGTAPREFAAFVDSQSEEMGYGYVVASNEETGTLSVVTMDSETAVEVLAAQLVEVRDLEGEDEVAAGVKMAVEASSDRESMVQYYKKLYSYAPEYVQKLIEMIDMHATA